MSERRAASGAASACTSATVAATSPTTWTSSKVREAVGGDVDVVVAETKLFACADGTQNEMVHAIQEQHLDGLVVASCSPKLHQITFRGVAKRAGLNPYAYTQVNVREQCSWAHTDDPDGATEKAIGLVKSGIAQTRLSQPLEPLVVETTPATMVVGGGVAGLRAAIGLADIGLHVYVVEKQPHAGRLARPARADVPQRPPRRRADRRTRRRGGEAPDHHGVHRSRAGRQERHVRQLHRRGTRDIGETLSLQVGTFIIATGVDTYQPEAGEFGYGIDGVLTLAEFSTLVDEAAGRPAAAQRPPGALDRLHLLRRQPAARRQRILLEVLLRRDSARLVEGRTRWTRR